MSNKHLLALLCFVSALAVYTIGCSDRAGSEDGFLQSPISPSPTEIPSLTPPPLIPTGTPTLTLTHSPTPIGKVELVAVGDLMLGRTVGDLILEKGPQAVFSAVQDVFDQADLRVGNLECAITDLGSPVKKTFILKAPPEAAQALAAGRIDLVSLANNHSMDYGPQGLARMQQLLAGAGIAAVGAGVDSHAAHLPIFFERNGLRLAFLAYVDVPAELSGFDARTWTAGVASPGVAWADPSQMKADIAQVKSKADVVIVLLHSGNEITPSYLSVINSDQVDEAHAAIDAGAALVIGSHPHELQSIERYHGGLIAYSLGNFVFDDYLGVANASIILRVTLTRSGFQDYDYVPVLIDNGLPHIITPALAPAIGTLVAP